MAAEVSVVLVCKYGFDRLHRVLVTLLRQSIADRLEIVMVSPFDTAPAVPPGFAEVRHVQVAGIDSLGPPRAAGVQACTTPYVIFGEDHCFPEPQWAETLLARLREGWAGVGPAILNHNPATLTSRTDWLLNYGAFAEGRAAGPTAYIAPHNSAYPTALLQGLGPELPSLLQMDHHLQSRILAGGGRFYFEPRARAAHTNLSLLFRQLLGQFDGCRVYGATRAAQFRWTWRRRLVYACGFPAILGLRMTRTCANQETWRSVRLLPLLVIASAASAAGEALGYVAGYGDSLLRRSEEELNRTVAVIESERQLLLP